MSTLGWILTGIVAYCVVVTPIAIFVGRFIRAGRGGDQ